MSEVEGLEFLEQHASDEQAPRRLRLGWGNLVLLAGVMSLAAVLAIQLARQNATQPTGGAAPEFSLRTFAGEDLQLSDLRGRVVLLNFWASWCPPCRDEAPDLAALYRDFQDAGLTIIGINILESSQAKAQEFIREFGISYPNGEDTGQFIAKLYRVEAPPENFLIDKRGNIHRFVLGAVSYDDMSASVRALLAERK